MRALVVLSFLSLVPACGTKDVDACAGATGTCLNVKVAGAGDLTSVDALDIRLVGGSIDATKRSAPSSALSLPLSVAVIIDPLPADPLTFDLTVTGYKNGVAVGTGVAHSSVGAGQHQSVSVTLAATSPAADMSVPDMASDMARKDDAGVSDMATSPDLDNADLAQPSEDGGCVLLPISNVVSNFEVNAQNQVTVTGGSFRFNVGAGETGTTTPAPGMITPVFFSPARGSSSHALHITASNLTGFGLNLNAPFADALNPVDLSHFTGMQFYAKGTSSAASATMRAGMNTLSSTNFCNSCAACNICTNCYDQYAKNITLSNTWTQYTVNFSEMAQNGWGVPQVAFSPTQTIEVVFVLPNGTWDVWIDDVTLIP